MHQTTYHPHTLAPDPHQLELRLVPPADAVERRKPLTALIRGSPTCSTCPYCHGRHADRASFTRCRLAHTEG